MNNKTVYTNIFWAVVILMSLALVFSFTLSQGPGALRLSMSDLVNRINAGEVEKITVNGNDLAVTLKSGEEATATKESESGLTETLKNYGVDSAALQGVA